MPEFATLVDGYRRFRDGTYQDQKARYDALAAHGQAPPVMIISCCDSRVDPATIFDTGPGQIFALRNVANLVPPFETGGGLHGASAAIEFGVLGLGVKQIVVLGHGQCGGIKAALQGNDPDGDMTFVGEWMGIIGEARDQVVGQSPVDPQRMLELEAIKVSIANLRTFPFITERERAGDLKLRGAYFAIDEGVLQVLDDGTGSFLAV